MLFHILQTRTEAERQKIASEFRQLRRFLKEKEVMLLARLGELDRAVLRRQEEEEAKVQGDISLLSILICEMEEKLKRPTRGFLQVGFLRVGCSIGSSPFLSSLLRSWGRLNLFFFPHLFQFQDARSTLNRFVLLQPHAGGWEGLPITTPMDSSAEMRKVCDSGKAGSPMGNKKSPWIPV